MSPRKKARQPEEAPGLEVPSDGVVAGADVDELPEVEVETATSGEVTVLVRDAPETPDRAVVFHLEEQRYALPVERVQEIQQIVALKEVPDPTEAVMGMIDLRGDVIPVIDLRLLVGLPFRQYDLQTPMIVCRVQDQLVALVVDDVQDVLELPEGCLRRASKVHALADRLLGVCRLDDDLVLLLDIDRVLPERKTHGTKAPKGRRRKLDEVSG